MGLQNNLPAIDPNNSYREDITNAYYKIEGVFIDTNKAKVRIQVRGFLSEYARHNQGIGIFKRVFYAPLETFLKGSGDGTNLVDFTITADTTVVDALVEKGYDYIKSLPEFEDAVDMLDPYDGDIDITEEIAEEQEKTLEQLILSLQG
jgi:hypothetical protein